MRTLPLALTPRERATLLKLIRRELENADSPDIDGSVLDWIKIKLLAARLAP